MEEDIRFINVARGVGEVLTMIVETGKLTRDEAAAKARNRAGVTQKLDTLKDAQKLLVAAVWVYNELNIRSTK